MKHQFRIIPAVVAAAIAIAPAAHAADGTIEFQGVITDTTCAISVNAGTNNGTVMLPAIGASALPAAGATAGTTPFTITLAGCAGATLNTAHTHFEMGPAVDVATGRLNNTSGTATGVQIEVLNVAQSPIRLGAAASQGDLAVDISSGGATLGYYARYYADAAAVTPGTVVSRVDYTIQYL